MYGNKTGISQKREQLKMEHSLIATNARRSTTVALSWTTIVIGYATHSCLVDRLLAATATVALSKTTIVIGYATHSCLVDRLLAATAE
jgi:multisubunit Na+/H+ antiporter MnhC subunit